MLVGVQRVRSALEKIAGLRKSAALVNDRIAIVDDHPHLYRGAEWARARVKEYDDYLRQAAELEAALEAALAPVVDQLPVDREG